MSAMDRFLTKIHIADSGCWLWTAATRPNGYGVFWDGDRLVGPHCFIYTQRVGPIPHNFQIDHLCRVRNCVNPAHLEAVTQRTNLLRGDTVSARAAKATHCPHGHPYDEVNTRFTKQGHRICRECRNAEKRKTKRAFVVREVDIAGRPVEPPAVTR